MPKFGSMTAKISNQMFMDDRFYKCNFIVSTMFAR